LIWINRRFFLFTGVKLRKDPERMAVSYILIFETCELNLISLVYDTLCVFFLFFFEGAVRMYLNITLTTTVTEIRRHSGFTCLFINGF